MFLIGLVGPNGSASITLHFSQPGPRTLRVFRVSQFGGKSETLLTGIPKKDEKKDGKIRNPMHHFAEF
jgi:L-aminopeptidase/D-esterase-like protein